MPFQLPIDALRIARKLRRTIFWKVHHQLKATKQTQFTQFNLLEGKFFSLYNSLKMHDISEFLTPMWQKVNAELETVFLPHPPFSFLNHPVITSAVFLAPGLNFIRQVNEELIFLKKQVPEKLLKNLLFEDYVGEPLLFNSKYTTSATTIRHLYHLVRYQNRLGRDLNDMSLVVEWGGGYGNMAKIFRKLLKKEHTYIIIDTPLFSCIQWLYLSSVLGEDNVQIINKQGENILPNKINLLSLCFLPGYNFAADFFVSTWALSESSKHSQDYIVSRGWFGAKHILLAFHDSSLGWPDSGRVGKLAADIGARIEDISFLPRNHYAFC